MFVGQSTRPRQQGRLPVETTGFIGRQDEVARLAALLEHARLVTVTGPGGVGKTRVALRAAAQAEPLFKDGVCLVELSALREPGLLAPAVADALGLPEQSAGWPQDAVLAHLRDRHLLLILDTCEHLIDDCAMFAEAIIGQAPRVTLLATSREPLDLIGENSCPIPPLPILGLDAPGGSAVDLFMERAAAAVPGFTVAPDQMRHVIRLCHQLDGLPLAIELAAARLRALSLAELASRHDERLVLLAGGQRGGRHRTLRDAISWSYDLCTPVEQALWARLAVFAGPVSISAAEQVCADGEVDRGQVMSTMIRLVDKSVIGRAESDDGSSGSGGQPTRYQMLDTIRAFGAERLAAAGADTATRGRLIARYLLMARGLLGHFTDDDQPDRLRELHREHASIIAALAYALGSDQCETTADGVELAIALSAYWRACGLTRQGRHWLGKAIERSPAGSAARARALLTRGYLVALQGNGELADVDAADGLRIGTQLGDDAIIAHGHLVRNLALSVSGRLMEAAEAGARAGHLLAVLDARAGLADLEIQLSYLALLNSDAEGAIEHVRRGRDLLGHGGERWLHSNLCLLGWLATRSGQHERAAWLLGAADQLWCQAGGRLIAGGTLDRLHAEAVARAADALGDQRYEEIFARAAQPRTDRVVAFAASDADDPGEDGSTSIPLSGQLTAREHEIATLVAHGLSNRQIAEKLFISRRTVDAHVEHIFAKLGIASRVTLAIALREQQAAVHEDASA
jgi:predicted ATPase/DNA-binding CsgD family transcriptional regulator